MGRVKSRITVTMRYGYDYVCGDTYISEENLVFRVFVK